MDIVSKQQSYTFLMKTKKRMREMMVRVSTRIPQNSPVLALLQSRLYLLDSLSQSGGSLPLLSYSNRKCFVYLLTCTQLSWSAAGLSPP